MMPSTVVPAVSPVLAESRFAGTVAITVFMVVSAVLITVVRVPPVFGASVHRAGRTAVSVIFTTIVRVPPVFGASVHRAGRASVSVIFMTVVVVRSVFGASIHRAGRTVRFCSRGIAVRLRGRRISVRFMMPVIFMMSVMGRNRYGKKNENQRGSHCRSNQFFKTHGAYLLLNETKKPIKFL